MIAGRVLRKKTTVIPRPKGSFVDLKGGIANMDQGKPDGFLRNGVVRRATEHTTGHSSHACADGPDLE